MKSVNPIFLIALAVAIGFVILVRLNNPYRVYSTMDYWESATLQSVADIPDGALEPGNGNGSVLMWAAMATANPDILTALVERGADINESDIIFTGTPLTGAAGFTSHPEIIDRLILLGADIHKVAKNGEDALMIAAQINPNPGIIERLLFHGADPTRKNFDGDNALDLAIINNNQVAIDALQQR